MPDTVLSGPRNSAITKIISAFQVQYIKKKKAKILSEVKELHRALWELLGKKLTKSEMPSQETLELNAGRHICV